jgi:hypothetical protein
MKIYCNTYDFVIRKNKETDGKYLIHFESSLTDNIFENELYFTYIYHSYKLDAHRRIFDKSSERNAEGEVIGGDNRASIVGSHNYINPATLQSTEHIPVIPLS